MKVELVFRQDFPIGSGESFVPPLTVLIQGDPKIIEGVVSTIRTDISILNHVQKLGLVEE